MTISSTTSSTAFSQSTSAPSSPSTSTVNARANAVGEGVVGGTLGLFMFCALLYGYFQWKERLARNREALLSQTDTENPAASEVVEEPSMTRVRVVNLIPPSPRSEVPSFVSSHS